MNAGKPTISAVIPTYNHGQYVVEAVKSALAQTYAMLEVIVVDDGSTDDTADKLKPFLERIRYIYQKNQGLSAARNTGIRAAKGEWIALLDSDDVWHPDKTSVQIQGISAVPACILIGSRPAQGELPEHLELNPAIRQVGVETFLRSTPFGPSSALIHRSAFERAGLFDQTLRSVEDRDFWLRVAAVGNVAQVDSPCWWYRRHEGQMSRVAHRMLSNFRLVLEKFFREHPQYNSLKRSAMAFMHLDAANCYYEERRPFKAIRHLLQSAAWHCWRASERDDWVRCKLLVKFLLGERAVRIAKFVKSFWFFVWFHG